jgi:hypothetical protein
MTVFYGFSKTEFLAIHILSIGYSTSAADILMGVFTRGFVVRIGARQRLLLLPDFD